MQTTSRSVGRRCACPYGPSRLMRSPTPSRSTSCGETRPPGTRLIWNCQSPCGFGRFDIE
ncbi:Uncharacterised protein [Mycobacteroides abscessus subsp. abscessus]|nr:Uncharacterised protein [Mycobacteroides abscessus subsp. abscessus]